MLAAVQLADLADVAVISMLYPVRSHTGAAQGGILWISDGECTDACPRHIKLTQAIGKVKRALLFNCL
jgi:hypothetical protein